jgi:hypothetical protein
MIVKQNELMKSVSQKINKDVACPLSYKLFEKSLYVTKDFVIAGKEGEDFSSLPDVWKNDFTAFEADKNCFYITQEFDKNILSNPEICFNKAITNGLFQKVIGGCEYVFNIFKNEKNIQENELFTLIASIDSYDPEIKLMEDIDCASASVRFTKSRQEESWVSEDLERYEQPIMTIDFDKKSVSILPQNWWL